METKTMIREVKHVAEKHKNDRKFTGQTVITDMCNDIIPKLEKLAEYETAEKEGSLVVLPCKNWLDIVFGEQELFYGIDMDDIENPIREITAHNEERFTWYDGWKTVVLKGVDENGLDWEFAPEEIGKTVFLTRGEAEKALKEMEDNHE